jgi:hypothetical protein
MVGDLDAWVSRCRAALIAPAARKKPVPTMRKTPDERGYITALGGRRYLPPAGDPVMIGAEESDLLNAFLKEPPAGDDYTRVMDQPALENRVRHIKGADRKRRLFASERYGRSFAPAIDLPGKKGSRRYARARYF